MRKRRRRAYRSGRKAVICWLLLVIAVCLVVRGLSDSGAGERLEKKLTSYLSFEKDADAAVRFDFGLPKLYAPIYHTLTEKDWKDKAVEEPPVESAIPEYNAETQDKDEKLEYSDTELFGSGEHLDASNIEFDNDAGVYIDADALLNAPLNFTVEPDEPTVLIVHTHGSEAYTPAGDDMYTESDPFRTENKAYNVVRVGDELEAELESYGISVIHDTTLHDYPSYNGSYNRAFETIANYIDEYPSIRIVIDLHRDAIENYDGTPHRTAAQIDGETCSQLLFVMGTNASGLDHPVWQENMKLAIKLQYAMNSLFPGLAKPICVSQYRYNQHMTSGSMILEVGCTGNTLQESVASMKYFAAAMAQVVG